MKTSLRVMFERGQMCPDCGNETAIETNGAGEYRCPECDHRWGFDRQAGEEYGMGRKQKAAPASWTERVYWDL